MSEVASSVCCECKKSGAKGTLAESVEFIDLSEIKKLPFGYPAEKVCFKFRIPDFIKCKKRRWMRAP